MRRIAAAAILALGLTSLPVFAADLAVKAPPAPPPPPSWTGFYVGGNFGIAALASPSYGFADPGGAAFGSCLPCLGGSYFPATLSNNTQGGILGGGHLGYNWQVGTWLLGVEGDFEGSNIKQQVASLLSSPGVIPVNGSVLTFETDVQWLASVRGRLGYVVPTSNLLLYATGGVAWGSFDFKANSGCPVPGGTGSVCWTATGGSVAPFDSTVTRTGFAVGGGLEWMLPNTNWRIRGEYVYYGFGDTDNGSSVFVRSTSGAPFACFNTGAACSANYTFGNTNVHTARVGVSYGF